MQILPVNNLGCNSKMRNCNNQTFRGLLGETTQKFISQDFDQTQRYCLDFYEEKVTYYPFKDETSSEIKNKIKDLEQIRLEWGDDNGGVLIRPGTATTAKVILKEKLPFTKKDFQDYLNKTVSDLKKMVIENHIIEKNLRLVK